MNTIDAIKNRHSYRGKYTGAKVPREDRVTILEAGLMAPSGCNKQTTSLICVDDPEVLKKVMGVIDPSAAIENMLLAIVDLGYQSCWFEGRVIAEGEPMTPPKKSFEERAWFNSFNGK